MSARRALIVDDEARIGRMLKRFLERLEYEVLNVDTGSSFRAAYEYFQPDLVLIDLQLADEADDDVSLLRFLEEQGSTVSVLLMSGVEGRVLESTAELGRSMGLRIIDPMPKPFEVDQLSERLQRCNDDPHTRQLRTSTQMSGMELKAAIADGQIDLFYQPIVELSSYRVVGLEALARWIHPTLDVIYPAAFLATAEQQGLMRALTSSLAGRAVQDLANWTEKWPEIWVRLNLSQTLLTDLKLPEQIQALLKYYEVSPRRLVLEITVDQAPPDDLSAIDVLTRLRLKGFRLALDDFGKGFSTLDQMYRLPYDILKIDKSFVQDMLTKDSAQAIVRSTVELGRSMNLQVVAGGIETQEACDELARMNCQLGQGSLFGMPMNRDALVSWSEEWGKHTAPKTLAAVGVYAPDTSAHTPDTGSGLCPLPVGTSLLWYEVEAVLGQGGYGITYRAKDNNLNQHVAIKEYLPREYASRAGDITVEAASPSNRSAYEQGLQRFLDEARTLARFQHPNIVRVYSVFEANGTAYMVMEFQRGQNLAQAVRNGMIKGQDTLLDILLSLMDGLAQVHGAGFIHRDIKPDNILICEDGTPVLLDFGSARQSLNGSDPLTAIVTPGFAPIEQYQCGEESLYRGPWTDFYALAATVYRVILGHGPVDAISRANSLISQNSDMFSPIAELQPDGYSSQFLRALDKGLAFQPKDRPQSVVQWLRLFPQPDTDSAACNIPADRLPLPPSPRDSGRERHLGSTVAS